MRSPATELGSDDIVRALPEKVERFGDPCGEAAAMRPKPPPGLAAAIW